MGNLGDLFQTIIVVSVVALIVLLVVREMVCWYFKFNKMSSVLEEIRDLLKGEEVRLENLDM